MLILLFLRGYVKGKGIDKNAVNNAHQPLKRDFLLSRGRFYSRCGVMAAGWPRRAIFSWKRRRKVYPHPYGTAIAISQFQNMLTGNKG
jgi:hypothetical protein